MDINSIGEIEVHHLILLETNYYYELLAQDDNVRHAQCMLLFGSKSDENTILFERSLVLPLTLNFKNALEASFEYSTEQLCRRIDLIAETNPDLNPYGILVLNEDIFDYSDVVQRLNSEHNLNILFSYEPKNAAKDGLKLKAFLIHNYGEGEQLGFKRIDFKLQNSNILLGDESEKTLDETYLEGPDDAKEEAEFVRSLMKQIDRMVAYLEIPENNNSEILRHISLLVSRLKREAGRDIEEEIMNKESEINALNIICEQWEIGSSQFR